jgi:hypothetical protein
LVISRAILKDWLIDKNFIYLPSQKPKEFICYR